MLKQTSGFTASRVMEVWNVTEPSPSANQSASWFSCTVDTSYRFMFYQVTYSIIFLLGLATNSLALRRLCGGSRCAMNSTAIYLVNLSTADLFFIVSLPLRIYYYRQKARALSSKLEDAWSPGAAYCQFTFTLKYISLYGGIFFLVCIAVDRYLAVVRPFASSRRRERNARLLSGAIWFLVMGLSVSLPALRYAAARRDQPCLLDPTSQRHRRIILTALGVVMTSFLLPTAILLYSYCRLLSTLRQARRSPRRGRRYTLTLIYWVLGVFMICFIPYHVNLLGYTLTHVGVLPSCGLAKVTKVAHPVVLSVASFNCCLNPLIYYFSSRFLCREVPGGRSSRSH
ncbi:lysophosphatidic acid receptor 6 [Hippocampus comes]|uniref:lysophosphatidic acid receptor 6 n=1 Tax=Hippocampus comes TaxID=109280 RepID=UPI00094E197B|nr:PREDICTED: lysophosphatidic acid receptor 6-like [Hippocampus comes]